MRHIKFCLILSSLLASIAVSAQQLPLGSHYFMNPFMLNSAFTGANDNMNVFLTHRSQFSGISGSPQTTYLTFDAPTSMKGIGLGLKAYSDVTSIISRTGVSGNYSYALNLGSDRKLTFGMSAGVIDNTINYDQAIARDINDPTILSQKIHRTVFSADFGVAYHWKQLEVGIAIPQLLGNQTRFRSANGATSYFDMQQHFVGTAKYVFEIKKIKGLTAYPMLLVRGVKGAPVQYDMNAVLDWKQWGWMAITYRSNYAVGMSAGVRFKQISAGYSHDFGVSKIRSYTGSTNEFMLSYQFGNDTKKRLDQHDLELEELRKRTDNNEAQIMRIEDELQDIRSEGNKTYHSRELEQAKIDSIYSILDQMNHIEMDSNSNLTDTIVKGYKTLKSVDFLDENGTPLPNGYYVVIGSYSIKTNAVKFRDERPLLGEEIAKIAFHKSISIYNVYVLYSNDFEIANEERRKQTPTYANTWLLELE